MTDHTDSLRIAKRMQDCTRKLNELASAVGSARQIREFSSDLRKNALSIEVAKALKEGQSATAAEHVGRASPVYQERLEMLGKQLEAAEQTISSWTATQASFEAARSLLSFSRETIRQL